MIRCLKEQADAAADIRVNGLSKFNGIWVQDWLYEEALIHAEFKMARAAAKAGGEGATA